MRSGGKSILSIGILDNFVGVGWAFLGSRRGRSLLKSINN
jgi:hypothetical protein